MLPSSSPPASRRQLLALGRVAERLTERAFDYWLFGGWAADFYAGRITRSHGDIDLAVWAHDREAIEAVLMRDGWTHAPAPDEDGGTGYARDGIRLELTFLVGGADGEVLIEFRAGPGLWSPSPFGDDVRELHGVAVRVIPRDRLSSA